MNLARRSVAVALACACTGSLAIDSLPSPVATDPQHALVSDYAGTDAVHTLMPLSPVAEPRPSTMMLAGLVALGCLMRLKRGAKR